MGDFQELFEKGRKEHEEGLDREKKKIKPKIPTILKDAIDKLEEEDLPTLLAMTMESLRGYWGSPEDRLAIIFYLCSKIETLPRGLLRAIEHNAYMFNGHYIDGRVFRDGGRESGLSGNLAYYVTGDDRIKQKGFYGTYGELWGTIGSDESRIERCYNKVLRFTDDMSWGNR